MIDDDDDDWLQRMIDDFQPGLYRHYKGNQYLALCLAREDETDAVVVVYTRLYPRPGLPTSTRRLEIWNEEIEYQGRIVPRFSYCGHVTEPDNNEDDAGDGHPRRGLVGWMKDNF